MNLDDPIRDLIEAEKIVDEPRFDFDAPVPGKKTLVRLASAEKRSDKFLLTIYEGKHSSFLSVEVSPGRKSTFQTMHSPDVLVRVDVDENARHTNPDGSVIVGSHVHIANEMEGSRHAYPISSAEAFEVVGSDPNIPDMFQGFLKFCHIDDRLNIRWSLGV